MFIHGENEDSGFSGTWDNDSTYKTLLYTANNKESDENSLYFINQPKYNKKWMPLFNLLDIIMQERESTSFWGSPYTGIRRINLYIQDGVLSSEHLNMLSDITSLEQFTVEDLPLVLEEPHKEGKRFLGWFDNPGFEGEPFEAITEDYLKDLILYAKWS